VKIAPRIVPSDDSPSAERSAAYRGSMPNISYDLTPAEVAYVRASYVPVDGSRHVRAWMDAGLVPQASYVLPDGSEMVPADHLALVAEAGNAERVPARFAERYRLAAEAAGVADELDDDWPAYLEGTYGICLRVVTPEAIVEKARLVQAIEALLTAPDPASQAWRSALNAHVEALDRQLRPFPDFEHVRFGRPTSRQRLIEYPHARYPEAFAPTALAS
jgi:hypothetical protein